MPGFIDTHHHQAWTAIRSAIPDSILIDDGTGTASAEQNYFNNVLAGFTGTTGFARHYRPQDVYISELFGGLSQLDAGVTTVLDISQIHHSKQHSDAAIQALRDTGRRAMLGYFESAGNVAGNQYPQDATRLAGILSSDALVGFVMGGEVYLGDRPTARPGRSVASSGSRSRRTSCRRSASARSWTTSPQAPAASATTSGSDPTTCSST